MRLIENNPFRMLGVSVNASARDIASNKGKMRLLEVGKSVDFPLDLQNLPSKILSPIERTGENVNVAEREINLPQDKVKYALFWFAQPTDPLGKLAYDHMLQGNVEKAQEIFRHSKTWESKLCLATLSNIMGDSVGAICAISDLIDNDGSVFVRDVVGQTYGINSNELRNIYIKNFCSDIGGISSIKLFSSIEDSAIPRVMWDKLRDISLEITIAEIENEISAAKIGDKKAPEENLDSLNRLRWLTQSRVASVREVLGGDNPRFRHLSDKLADLLRISSIRYYNAVHNSQPTAITKKVVNTCMEIVEYAMSICYGKSLREKLDEDLKFLKDTKEKVLPVLVEQQLVYINSIINKYESLEEKSIGNAISMMKDCAHHIVILKEHSEYRNHYLSISTKVVDAALSWVIDEHNRVSKKEGDASTYNENRRNMYKRALRAVMMMDEFDKETEFNEKQYKQNRETIRKNAEKDGVDMRMYGVWIDFNEFDIRTEDEVYNDCCSHSDYIRYLSRYPNARHKTEAQQEIDRLRNEEENRRRKKEEAEREAKRVREADDKAFYACKTEGDYRDYIKAHPYGLHRTEAEKRKNELEKQIRQKKVIVWGAMIGGAILVIAICSLFWGVDGILASLLTIAIATLVFVIAFGKRSTFRRIKKA